MLFLQNCEYEKLHNLLDVGFDITRNECSIQFTAIGTSEGTYEWDFGDGQLSTIQNPIHEYQASGTYEVKLVFTNRQGAGSYSQTIVVEKNMVADIEGNCYRIVTIGNQTWMAENLRSTKCMDGSSIPLVEDASAWQSSIQAAYTWPNNDQEAALAKNHGALYNFYAINTCNICPEGWHIPTLDEVNELKNFLSPNEANKLRAKGNKEWLTNIGTESNWVNGITNNECTDKDATINIRLADNGATALHFDGIDDEVNFGDIDATDFGTNDFSIEFWINTTDSTQKHIVNKRAFCTCNNFWSVVLTPSGQVYVEVSEEGCRNIDSLITNLPINDGIWHHIAATRLEHTLSIYIDGKLERSKTSSNIAHLDNNSVLRIANSGCVEIGAITPFGGAIDELRIWNRALDSKEILQNKDCELEGTESELVAYYDFNQGIALEVNTEEILLLDRSSNEHHGTLLNFSLLGTNNETGWTALPVGLRAPILENYFEDFGTAAYFWTSDVSIDRPNSSNFYFLLGDQSDLNLGSRDKKYGLSVRCLKDR